MNVEQIIQVFDRCFGEQYSTRLCGGAGEPLYLPPEGEQPAQLFFRADYSSSALHEVAHWCLACAKRRQRADFGYEYAASTQQCRAAAILLQAELRTQSLEFCSAAAAGVRFTISTDNFNQDGTLDAQTIEQQRLFSGNCMSSITLTKAWLTTQAGARARRFMQALESARG